jgi:hypothetical protein
MKRIIIATLAALGIIGAGIAVIAKVRTQNQY